MAIDYNGAALLLSAKRRDFPIGRVLMLGRQHLSLTIPEIASLQREFGLDLQAFSRQPDEEVFAEPFLEYLGATSITSLDFSDYEDSSICHDLNEPIPEEMKGKYDCVIDGGTLEHVFNFPCAIRNVMELLAPGGYFFGNNPADNWLGHGFYQFSPELFFRVFTEANGCEVVDLLLCEGEAGGSIYKVSDPAEAGYRIGLNSNERLYSLVLAKKNRTVEKLLEKTPQQSDYTARWEAGDEQAGAAASANGLKQLAKKLLPARVVKMIRKRAIEKRQAAEGARSLTEIKSMSELD